jgi:hypothetical protein
MKLLWGVCEPSSARWDFIETRLTPPAVQELASLAELRLSERFITAEAWMSGQLQLKTLAARVGSEVWPLLREGHDIWLRLDQVSWPLRLGPLALLGLTDDSSLAPAYVESAMDTLRGRGRLWMTRNVPPRTPDHLRPQGHSITFLMDAPVSTFQGHVVDAAEPAIDSIVSACRESQPGAALFVTIVGHAPLSGSGHPPALLRHRVRGQAASSMVPIRELVDRLVALSNVVELDLAFCRSAFFLSSHELPFGKEVSGYAGAVTLAHLQDLRRRVNSALIPGMSPHNARLVAEAEVAAERLLALLAP